MPIDDVRASAAYRRHALPCARGPRSREVPALVRIALTVNGEPLEGGRLGRREPAHLPPRHARASRLEERVRAGRVRLLLRAHRRRARLRVPRPRRAGGRPRGRHRRGPRDGDDLHPLQQRSSTGRGAVRVLHARARRRRCDLLDGSPTRPRTRSLRRFGQPLPLHRLPEDLRRRAHRRRTADELTSPSRLRRRPRSASAFLRADAIPKVTGEFAYASDLPRRGCCGATAAQPSRARADRVDRRDRRPRAARRPCRGHQRGP